MRRALMVVVLAGCTAPNPAYDDGTPTDGAAASGSASDTVSGPTDTTAPPGTQGGSGVLDTSGTSSVDVTGPDVDTTRGDPTTGSTGVLDCPGCDGACIEGICMAAKLVFSTSKTMDGALGGLESADASCTELATSAGHEGDFMAWLSDETSSPSSRMTHHDGPYILPGGTVVATSWTALTSGNLLHPIDRNELGDPTEASVEICVGAEVWTGTRTDGTVRIAPNCQNWTSTIGTGEVGHFDRTDTHWTESELCGQVSCSSLLPLYCVQQ